MKKFMYILSLLCISIFVLSCYQSTSSNISADGFPLTYDEYIITKSIMYKYAPKWADDTPQSLIDFYESEYHLYLNSEEEQEKDYKRMVVVYSEAKRLGIKIQDDSITAFASEFFDELIYRDEGFGFDMTQAAVRFEMSMDTFARDIYAQVRGLEMLTSEYFYYYVDNVSNTKIMTQEEFGNLKVEIGVKAATIQYYDQLIPIYYNFNEYLDNIAEENGL